MRHAKEVIDGFGGDSLNAAIADPLHLQVFRRVAQDEAISLKTQSAYIPASPRTFARVERRRCTRCRHLSLASQSSGFTPIEIKMRFAWSLHFSVYQLEPEEPTLLHRERKPLLATRMSLCAGDPRMVFRAKTEYLWATLVVIVENVVPLCHWLRATFDQATLPIDDEFAPNYHANIVLWLTLPRAVESSKRIYCSPVMNKCFLRLSENSDDPKTDLNRARQIRSRQSLRFSVHPRLLLLIPHGQDGRSIYSTIH